MGVLTFIRREIYQARLDSRRVSAITLPFGAYRQLVREEVDWLHAAIQPDRYTGKLMIYGIDVYPGWGLRVDVETGHPFPSSETRRPSPAGRSAAGEVF